MGTIDLNLLPIFAAVAETSSFSRAAAKLGLPKSSVSRAIASLEDAMGVRLVHRTTRNVSLSTAGSSLLERTTPSLALLESAVSGLPELQEEPSGHLRVTAPVDLGSGVLAEIVARFSARYPSVVVELHLTNAVVDIVAEGFDVALRISARELKDSSLSAKDGGTVGMQLYASPSYLARRGTPRTPSEIEGHSWIGFRNAEKLRLIGPGKQITLEPRSRIVCDDMYFIRETLRHGAGLGVLPKFIAHDDVTAGELVCVLPRWTVPTGRLWVVSPGARHLPRKVIAFRDFILEALRAKPL